MTLYGRSCLKRWSVATTPQEPFAVTSAPSSTSPSTSIVHPTNYPEHIRQYQAAMFTQWNLAPHTVTQQLAAFTSRC